MRTFLFITPFTSLGSTPRNEVSGSKGRNCSKDLIHPAKGLPSCWNNSLPPAGMSEAVSEAISPVLFHHWKQTDKNSENNLNSLIVENGISLLFHHVIVYLLKYNKWKSSPIESTEKSQWRFRAHDAGNTSISPRWLLLPAPTPEAMLCCLCLALGPLALPRIPLAGRESGASPLPASGTLLSPTRSWYLKHNEIALSCFAHRFCCAAQYTSEEKFLALKPSIYEGQFLTRSIM